MLLGEAIALGDVAGGSRPLGGHGREDVIGVKLLLLFEDLHEVLDLDSILLLRI